ncbi:pentapeptide repeat-containing protein [Falsihalocynthiibacter arcticus]|uniref:Pentapeptide repeat-containing protein n=1 Tax=Falsihalocynthiibacter arcticus TaxID=1579316 RepID=A0A126V1X2_9RHOB|nr:pentapeptide repeat-containing protein [Falsihalocynthiibacter arcticus]AML52321.1 hypothetical protein RC74_14490 [Falsihalocynthiibacter arcticus]
MSDSVPPFTITFPFDENTGTVFFAVLAVLALSFAVYGILQMPTTANRNRDWKQQGIEILFVFLIPVWICLMGFVIWTLISLAASFPDYSEGDDLRWHALALVGLMTSLAGLIGTPFVFLRAQTTERHTVATEQGLITDRITKAVEQIGAVKTVIKDDKSSTLPNIEVRIGGLYALENIAQQNLEVHIQIMDILCAYVRENLSNKIDNKPGELSTMTDTSPLPKAGERLLPDDVSVVFKIISRRSKPQKKKEESRLNSEGQRYVFDFSTCNFIHYRLWWLSFDNCRFWYCDFSGATFFRNEIQNSDFMAANFSSTTFNSVKAENTKFHIVATDDLEIEHTSFLGCQFFKFDFAPTRISNDTQFDGSQFSSEWNVVTALTDEQKETALGIGNFDPTDGHIPKHWTTVEATNNKVDDYWREWQKTNGSQPK